MADHSLELTGGVKILNPVPSDPRTKTIDLASIANDPTYYVGFSPIYNQDDGLHYKIIGGNATIGWEFEETGSGSGGGASERPNITASQVVAQAQTTTVDFSTVKVLTVPFADTITTHILAVANMTTAEKYNTVVIDNSINSSGLVLTMNDQTGAITYRRAKNDFPGTYPDVNIPAGSKWEISFENRSATVTLVDFVEVEE